MKNRFSRLLLAVIIGSAFITVAAADSYTTSSGSSYEGEIAKIHDGVVHLKVGGENVEVALSDFDAASSSAIQKWAKQNPALVDVYTKWDAQPRIKSSAMPTLPEQFHNPDFVGMVSVDLVLSESGHVLHASISKSTHEGLETPSLEAAKTWIFEPAQIGGQPVKSKLRVPFRFVFTPTAPPAG